jgi:hypothetical protein
MSPELALRKSAVANISQPLLPFCLPLAHLPLRRCSMRHLT